MHRTISGWRHRFAIACFSILSAGNAHAAQPSPGRAAIVPPLSQIIALARAQAPDVVASGAEVDIARSTLVGARLPPIGNPYLEVLGRAPPSGPYARYSIEGTLWLPVEVSGQRSSRIAESNALVEFQRSRLAYVQALATAEAIRAYGLVTVEAERARLLEGLLEVARREATSYEERYRAGDATLRDARLAELELGRYGVMLEESRGALTQGMTELERLTGHAFAAPPDALDRPPPIDWIATVDGAPVLAVSRAEASYYGRAKDRAKLEGAAGSLSLMLDAARDELGGARVGAGVAYAFPMPRRNQGEQARADAERARALTEARLNHRVLGTRVRGLTEELSRVQRALTVLGSEAEPAAVSAVQAAEDMQRAGKSDLFPVLTSRRDLGLLRLRRLDLVMREWTIVSELAAMTGRRT